MIPRCDSSSVITSDQVAKITQQQTDFQKAGIQGRATLEVKHLELRQLMSGSHPDRAAIDAKLQEISTAQLAAEKTEYSSPTRHEVGADGGSAGEN